MSGASWYDSNFKYRWPVAVDITGGGGTSGTYDIEVVIPAKWDLFWDEIRNDGHDIYAVGADGSKLIYARSGFDKANRVLTIQIDGYAVTNNDAIHLIYIYWGYPGASDGSAAVTIASPKSGQIFLGTPTNMVAGDTQNIQGSESASSAFSKPVEQGSYIWFRFQNLLANRLNTYNKFLFYEGVQYVQPSVYHPTGPTLQAAMIDKNKTRFLPGWVGIFVQAGSNDQDYLARCDTVTTENQTFSMRATLSIRNQFPAVR